MSNCLTRRSCAILLAVLLLFTTLNAAAEEDLNLPYDSAFMYLRLLGFTVDPEAADSFKQRTDDFLGMFLKTLDEDFRKAIISQYRKPAYLMYAYLLDLGLGITDEKTGAWTPASDRVYAFDAEFYDIENMYSLFLQGVQSIVPDAVFADVEEDISGMTWELSWSSDPAELPTDGTRRVSFICNGHPYSIELTSYGDWFNGEMLDFVNDVLRAEGCRKQLHILSPQYDQMVLLIYDNALSARLISGALDPY